MNLQFVRHLLELIGASFMLFGFWFASGSPVKKLILCWLLEDCFGYLEIEIYRSVCSGKSFAMW